MAEGLSARQRSVKRAFDLVVAAVGLVLASPVIVIGWLVASASTRANGFFAQERVGLHGQSFRVIKLRSMREVSAAPTGHVTVAGDQRVTRGGALLRRLKLDELPQLFNVIVGEMSLVGPRPDVPGFADQLKGEDRILLTLRPGITGPASLAYRDEEALLLGSDDPVRFNREVIWPEKVRINREYLATWSLSQDIRYLVQTVLNTQPQEEALPR